MTPEAAEVLGRASRVNLCTCVVVGIKANGGGLYINWSGETIHSLITHLEAAKAQAVAEFLAQTEVDHSAKEAAE